MALSTALSNIIADARVKRMGVPTYLDMHGGCRRRASASISDIDEFIARPHPDNPVHCRGRRNCGSSLYPNMGRMPPCRIELRRLHSYALAKTEVVPLLFTGDDFALTDIEAALPA
jgi:uncharacterized protein with PIN domain